MDQKLVRQLSTLAFTDAAQNVVLIGGPGTGKTHLATAIGIEAIQRQIQRVQEEVGGFVPGVIGAMSEEELGFSEAADGKTHQIAQRAEFVLGLLEEV